MIQEGKTNFLKWLLSICPVRYTVFDTLGQVRKGFNPVKPDIQQVITPRFDQRLRIFEQTCNDVWNKGNQVFAIDEISEFCSKWELPDHLGRIIKMGGNRNIGVWVTTQRVAQVHNDVLAGCKHHFIFRTYLPQDVEWYSKVVPKDIILMAKDLPQWHFIYYQLGKEPQVFKPVKEMR
jgi:DNA helicase HerA-like ATPase